ncbi:hypothetical protein C0966_17470 (plasmid) [Bacillus methanolicus]|uniref:RES family NAD+ phosphorylase n=1 Tax=Bacillus methanolicus TaxID=1471 RepID=UPI00237FFDD4|nr:RES family NAD+ phosphorylase [Bacillus methanolicus]MDE3841054.1 hypothetical protein [Bacillus methanolicus]
MEMYCSNCNEYRDVFDLLEQWEIYTIPETVRGYEYDSLEYCDNCGIKINLGTYVIKDIDAFTTSIGKLIATELCESEIGECQWCNDDIIIFTQKHGDPFDLKTVYELVEGYDIPEDIKSEVYSNIYCSNCHTPLESDQPYVTTDEVDAWYQDTIELVVTTFEITESKGEEFINYLLQNPMLGLNHPVGKKIFNKIKEKKLPGITTLKSGERYLRGRKRNNIERIAPFISDELWNPPQGFPVQGRYNPPGISSLYLASNMNVVIKEVPLGDNESIDIAEFLLLEDLKVWDVRDLDIEIFSSIPSFNKGLLLRYEYIFPNFIAQCVMANKFNGIVYNSTRSDGFNLCLINFRKNKDLVIEKVHTFNDVKPLLESINKLENSDFDTVETLPF